MGGLPLKGSSSTVATAESQPNQGSAITKSVPESKPKKKICCACPETKKLRDECIVEHGEESCAKWIEAHRAVGASAAGAGAVGATLALSMVLCCWNIHLNKAHKAVKNKKFFIFSTKDKFKKEK
ncbi:hypothetical protein Dsin_022354 [Dipteronia sinensis]|uniref:Cytochrome c oxidase copper chaperone n=1 Tax=Dipteronia sinensis TaxID=43782 RepID=A0AAE0DZZ4_9ROSI|nr:hypothetical protein Dsin_022354 [Dipteronia sinensis]